MKQYLIVLTALWLGCAGSYAQTNEGHFEDVPRGDVPTERNAYTFNRHFILKVTPITLIDPNNTVQAGLEIPLPNPRYSVQQEIGYGHSSFSFFPSEREEYPNKETWRFRTQLRKYYRLNQNGAGYFAVDYLFKKNSFREWKAVGMDCASPGQCAYFENRQVSLGRFVNAVHFKMGWQYILGPRMNLDLYWGLGLRSLKVRTLGVENEPLSANRDFIWFGTDRPGLYGPAPSLSLGFHLGWVLGDR